MANKIKIIEPDLELYLKYDNRRLLILALIIGVLFGFLFTDYILLIIVLYTSFIGIRFYLYKDFLTKYLIEGKDNECFLFSKLAIYGYDTKAKHLEDFLWDFRFCNWDDKDELNAFKTVFKLIQKRYFPTSKTCMYTDNYKYIMTNFKCAKSNIDDGYDDQLKINIEALQSLLDDVDSFIFHNNLDRVNNSLNR